jgi:hypothetical protein
MLNARCANLPVELLVLFTHSVLLLIVIYKWRPSRGQNDGSQTVLNQDCMEDEAEQSTALLQYLPLHRPVCSLALSGRRRTCFIFLFGRPFQLSVWTSLMSAYVVVIPNQCINLVFCLCHCCCGLSANVGPITNILFSAFKMMDPASNWANICCILTIHVSQASVNLYQTAAFRSNKFTHYSLASMCVHNIRHLALLLFWMHVTDWGTDDPGGANGVAIRWVRQGTLPAPHLRETKLEALLSYWRL